MSDLLLPSSDPTNPNHPETPLRHPISETFQSAFRIPRPRGFLPLGTDDLVTTRGQPLPGLIQSRSSSSLHKLGQSSSSAVVPGRAELGGSTRTKTAPMPGVGSSRPTSVYDGGDPEADPERERRGSAGALALMTPQMRSMRLIGNSNPRYQWEKYIKTEEELKKMKKPIRKYYERTNYLVAQYMYIDRLLDSSLPHDLIQEYHNTHHTIAIPKTITEEPNSPAGECGSLKAGNSSAQNSTANGQTPAPRVKRTPKDLYRVPNEQTPLLAEGGPAENMAHTNLPELPGYEGDDDAASGDRIVVVAIYVNLAANTILLIAKICAIVLTNSLSVLASLVDAALDFLSTAIVWTTTRMIARFDSYSYPVGRRRLEPIGVLVFSIIMITAFFQVMLECFNRLIGDDHSVVELTLPAIIIMASTVVIKGIVWLWCRLIKNSSVQALAQDAMTDVVFNTFSIIFPLIGFAFKLWYLDALGGLLLSLYVILNWSRTSAAHIRNLTGAAATADERNVLLYLTMRFAKTIRQIQGLQAYHAGDKLIVEVDIVLDEEMTLRDSHDLGESLQYVLESVPTVDRAFVHQDYQAWNLPSHMQQQS